MELTRRQPSAPVDVKPSVKLPLGNALPQPVFHQPAPELIALALYFGHFTQRLVQILRWIVLGEYQAELLHVSVKVPETQNGHPVVVPIPPVLVALRQHIE